MFYMLHEFVIINRYQKREISILGGEWLVWKTCLRQSVFGLGQQLSHVVLEEEDQVYRGEEAYRFALEVICGLHSPVVAETEVFGQFKKLSEQYVKPSQAAFDLTPILKSLNVDAKEVRHQYLSGLGSQSYGSVVRRLVRGLSEIRLMGAGSLTQELLPWLRKLEVQLWVHCRDQRKAAEDLKPFLPQVKLTSLEPLKNETAMPWALLIAAPLPRQEIHFWLKHCLFPPAMIVDLRGESAVDPLELPYPIVSLADIFAQIEKTKANVQSRVDQAKIHIQSLASTERMNNQVRSFGWDGLCA